jgi:hypothetical protein
MKARRIPICFTKFVSGICRHATFWRICVEWNGYVRLCRSGQDTQLRSSIPGAHPESSFGGAGGGGADPEAIYIVYV